MRHERAPVQVLFSAHKEQLDFEAPSPSTSSSTSPSSSSSSSTSSSSATSSTFPCSTSPASLAAASAMSPSPSHSPALTSKSLDDLVARYQRIRISKGTKASPSPASTSSSPPASSEASVAPISRVFYTPSSPTSSTIGTASFASSTPGTAVPLTSGSSAPYLRPALWQSASIPRLVNPATIPAKSVSPPPSPSRSLSPTPSPPQVNLAERAPERKLPRSEEAEDGKGKTEVLNPNEIVRVLTPEEEPLRVLEVKEEDDDDDEEDTHATTMRIDKGKEREYSKEEAAPTPLPTTTEQPQDTPEEKITAVVEGTPLKQDSSEEGGCESSSSTKTAASASSSSSSSSPSSIPPTSFSSSSASISSSSSSPSAHPSLSEPQASTDIKGSSSETTEVQAESGLLHGKRKFSCASLELIKLKEALSPQSAHTPPLSPPLPAHSPSNEGESSVLDIGKELLEALDLSQTENPPKRVRYNPPTDDAYPLWDEFEEDELCDELTFLVEKIGVTKDKQNMFMSYLI